jgi:putative transposase
LVPRRPRLQAAGIYHVRNHAVANSPLFNDEYDFSFRLGLVEQAVREGRMRCHAICLMGNHDHLLIGVEDGQLASVMQRINRNYAGNFNYRWGRRGRVYWAPYGSSPVNSDAYLLELIRYFALNPEWVARGRAEDYVWSSYPDLIDLRRAMPFVDPTPLLDVVGGGPAAKERIMQVVADGRVIGRRRMEDRLPPVRGPGRRTGG